MGKSSAENDADVSVRKSAVRKSTRSAAVSRTVRKAPTKATVQTRSHGIGIKTVLAVFVAAAVLTGIGVFIGMSDDGQIDVNATISQRAAVLEAQGDVAGSEATKAVAEQNAATQNALPNGGLVGRGNLETRQQELEARNSQTVAETASTTASSTEEADPSEDDSADGNENETALPEGEQSESETTDSTEPASEVSGG